MTTEFRNLADNTDDGAQTDDMGHTDDGARTDDVGKIIENLTMTVEKEVRAFHALLDVLVEQQASILQGDAESVSKSNEEVERIVSETRQLEKEVRGRSRLLSEHLEIDRDLPLSEIIPLVEQRYSERLTELRELLITLHQKIQRTNQRNSFLLENSLRFIDESSKILAGGVAPDLSYSKEGKTKQADAAMYTGIV
jgi:hypothetical protein